MNAFNKWHMAQNFLKSLNKTVGTNKNPCSLRNGNIVALSTTNLGKGELLKFFSKQGHIPPPLPHPLLLPLCCHWYGVVDNKL